VRVDAVDLRVAPTYQQRITNEDAYAIDRVRFRIFDEFDVAVAALQNGAVDALATRHKNDRPALLGVGGVQMFTGIESSVGVLIYNYNRGDSETPGFFSDARVRNALQLGLERNLPVNSRLNNRAVLADTPIPFRSWAYAEDVIWPSHNPARAADLLQTVQRPEAEATEEADAPPAESESDILYSFSILVPDDDAPRIALAQDIAAQWMQFNLDVTVESVPPQVFQQRLEAGDFDTAIVEYPVGTDPDVYAYWHSGQYPDGLNYGAMLDSRVDETLERARREASGLNRARLYEEFQAQFVSRGLAIPLYYPLYAYAVSERIDGVQIGYMGSPEHRFRTLSDWRIE
jgi:peptide/nickel transport system substrate-binding protein